MAISKKIRKLKCKKKPAGWANFVVKINHAGEIPSPLTYWNISKQDTAKVIEAVEMLKNSKNGRIRMMTKKMRDQSNITHLYIENQEDVFMLKLCFPDIIWKIYEVVH